MNRILILLTSMILAAQVSAEQIGDLECGTLYYHYLAYQKNEPKTDSVDIKKSNYYAGFISGFVSGNVFHRNPINFPKSETYNEYAVIVGKWLESHPEEWSRNSVFCTYMALIENYGSKN